MRPGHCEDPCGPCNEVIREGLAAKLGEVDAEALEDLHRMDAGGLAPDGADAGAGDLDVFAPGEELAHEALGHGTAADITRANEERGLGCGVVCHEKEVQRAYKWRGNQASALRNAD